MQIHTNEYVCQFNENKFPVITLNDMRTTLEQLVQLRLKTFFGYLLLMNCW